MRRTLPRCPKSSPRVPWVARTTIIRPYPSASEHRCAPAAHIKARPDLEHPQEQAEAVLRRKNRRRATTALPRRRIHRRATTTQALAPMCRLAMGRLTTHRLMAVRPRTLTINPTRVTRAPRARETQHRLWQKHRRRIRKHLPRRRLQMTVHRRQAKSRTKRRATPHRRRRIRRIPSTTSPASKRRSRCRNPRRSDCWASALRDSSHVADDERTEASAIDRGWPRPRAGMHLRRRTAYRPGSRARDDR